MSDSDNIDVQPYACIVCNSDTNDINKYFCDADCEIEWINNIINSQGKLEWKARDEGN
jgi:hypothetical protein